MLKYLLLFLICNCVMGLHPVEVKGNAFFVKGSNERFYIRGIDYQPGGSSNLKDPLADPDTCKRDIPYLKELGVNTIRVYSVDNTEDHEECMRLLADAGIYVIADVNIPDASISRKSPKCSYNTRYLNEVFATVKTLAKYDNTLGFFAGNEVINDEDYTVKAAPYVKAVVRDIKSFIKQNKLRSIPVGYSAADIEVNRLETAHYFNCGDDELARVDMFGFNDYSWCGYSSFKVSGFDQKVKSYSNYSVPLFLSEFGCNEVTPRPFTEIEMIYSEQMSSVFSGGLVYEYSEEASNYGLVEIDGDSIKKQKDFNTLKQAFNKAKNPSGDGKYQIDLPHSNCPTKADDWDVSSRVPSTPKAAQEYIKGNKEPQGNGFDASTQWACSVEDADPYDSNDSDNEDEEESTSRSRSKTLSSSRSSNKSNSSNSKAKNSGCGFGKSKLGLSLLIFSFNFFI